LGEETTGTIFHTTPTNSEREGSQSEELFRPTPGHREDGLRNPVPSSMIESQQISHRHQEPLSISPAVRSGTTEINQDQAAKQSRAQSVSASLPIKS